MKIMVINFKDLPEIRKGHLGQKIVFSSGTFDLAHAGHVLFFEDAKRQGDILVVMVGNDKAVKKSKGRDRPILNQHVRLKMVDSFKPVDYSFLDYFREDDYYFGCLEEAMKLLRPETLVMNDDARDVPARKKLAKKYGVKLVILPRTAPKKFEKISTTKIIEKIKKG